MEDLLPLALAVVFGLLFVTVSSIFAVAGIRTLRERRVGPRLEAARRELGLVADGTLAPDGARTALARLSLRPRLLVLVEMRSTFSGAAGERLEMAAVDAGVPEVVAKWRRSRRWHRRLHALRVASSLGIEADARAAIIDAHAAVRTAAVEWIGQRGHATDMPALFRVLSDASPAVRFAAQDAFVARKTDAVPALESFLGLARSDERLQLALSVAAAIGTPDLGAAAAASTTHEVVAVRVAAVRAVTAGGAPGAARLLTDLFTDPSALVRAESATGVGVLGDWRSGVELAGLLGDPEWQVRCSAAIALRSLGSPGMLFLQDALNSSDESVANVSRYVLAGDDGGMPAGFDPRVIAPRDRYV